MIPILPGGAVRTKPIPSLAAMNVTTFQREIEWIKGFLDATHGVWVTEARLCPYLERWYFYRGHDIAAIVEHETVEKLYGYLLLKTAEG